MPGTHDPAAQSVLRRTVSPYGRDRRWCSDADRESHNLAGSAAGRIPRDTGCDGKQTAIVSRRALAATAGLGRLALSAGASPPRHLLQPLEGQPLRIAYAGQIHPADEGGDSLAVAPGQDDDGIHRGLLGLHGTGPPGIAPGTGKLSRRRLTAR